MRPLRRRPVNKRRSANKFRKHVGKTKPVNLKRVMRGGLRI